VRDRVSRTCGALPREADEPVISKVEAGAQAIMWLAFASDRHSALEITDYAERYVKDRLQSLPGVASINIGGQRRYAMRIWLERARLAAYGITPRDIEEALEARNLEVPGGRIEGRERELTVVTETDLRTPEEFNALIIRQSNGYPVRLRDIGRAEFGAEDERNAVRVNGTPAVGLGVVKQSTTNTLASEIGLVMFIGLITKNGILIMEFANRLRARGYNAMAAVQEAAALRLRPILMTTSAMILGALPLALAGSPGAESRAPIGWVIVGGLSFGTLLTLFVIPTAYTLLARRDRATGAEAFETSPLPAPAAMADRLRLSQSRREWAQKR
jgi:multidrug efflux pump subunit AcrB